MTTRSQASSPGGKSNNAAATNNDAPATLSVLDLKSQLLSSMKKNGVLGNLKAQLRTQFLSELKSLAKEDGRGGPFDVNRHRGQKQNLRTRVLNTLFLEHLRSMGYKYSLSVFLPESGVNTSPPLSKLEILQVLNIRKGHAFYTKLASTLGEMKAPLLEQKTNGNNTLISAILEGLESSSTVHDSFTQTDDGNTPSERLLKRLDDVEYSYRQQQQLQATGQGSSASVEDRLIQYQRKVDRKAKEEIAAEIDRIKSVEIQQMKMEERAHHRATLEVELRRLQEEHQRQIKAMKDRKDFVEEQMRRREREMEKTSFDHRQQILKEIELNRLKEEDIQRSSELEKRSIELEKTRLDDMEKDFMRERKRFEADRAEWSRRCQSDMNQFKVDIRRQYQTREQDIEKKEQRLKDDRNAFIKEQANGRVVIAEAQGIKDELESARKTAQTASQKANGLALELGQAQEHLRIVANAANGDRDAHRKASELNESLTRQLAKIQQDMVDSRNQMHKQIDEKETLIRALGERLADEQSKNAQLQRKHGEEIRNIRSGQDDGIEKLQDSLRWKDNELISVKSEMNNRINSLQRDLDLLRPRVEEAETNLSIKETEIVELKSLLQKARLALDKVTQNSQEDSNNSRNNQIVLNDPNALLASLRKRRAGRVQEQTTLVPPPSQYLYMNRPPPMMYPPSWQAQPPNGPPQQQQQPPQQQQQQQQSNTGREKDNEMMKLKLEKLDEERKKRELAAEIEKQKMEEKFQKLKEEHEETLLKHEMAVINAKERSADIVEDSVKLLQQEKDKAARYRSEMKEMEEQLRQEKRNRNAVKAKSSPSPRKNNMANSNIQNNSTTFETPNLLKSTSPKVNKYSSKSPSPSSKVITKKKSPSPIKQKSAEDIQKEKDAHKEKMRQVRLEEKRKLEAARAQREKEKQLRLQKEAERKKQDELKAEKERLEQEKLEEERQKQLAEEARLKKEKEDREEALRKQKEMEEKERLKTAEQKAEELKKKKEEEEKQRLKEEGEKKLKDRMDEIRKSREMKKQREEEAAALKKMSAVSSPVQKEDSYGDDSWGSLPLDESGTNNKSGMGDNKKGDSSDAFDLSGMNDEDEIDEDEDMEVYEVGSDSADEEFEF